MNFLFNTVNSPTDPLPKASGSMLSKWILFITVKVRREISFSLN